MYFTRKGIKQVCIGCIRKGTFTTYAIYVNNATSDTADTCYVCEPCTEEYVVQVL